MSYITNSFLKKDKNVLLFNVFIKNNKLYLIVPIGTNKSKIKIIYNSNELICSEEIQKHMNEATQIIIYDFYFDSEDTYKITISINEQTKVFMLKHEKTYKNKKLALTTLFKDDYKLNKIFYDYYKKQGIQHFYMYYNGKITDEIKKYFDKEDITLLEWDYIYEKPGMYSAHYAQPAQMHDAIYRFGKDNYEYLLFCDLDEYLHIENQKLINLVSDTSIDTFGFHNLWSNTKDFIIPDKFPNEFYVSENLCGFKNRSKCIHKMDSVVYIDIHKGSKYKSKEINLKHEKKYIMFHFSSWSRLDRKEKTYKLFNYEP